MVLELRLADRSKRTTSFIIPHIDFISEEHITPATLLALVDDIGIAPQTMQVAFNISASTKPADCGTESSSRTSATVRRTGCG